MNLRAQHTANMARAMQSLGQASRPRKVPRAIRPDLIAKEAAQEQVDLVMTIFADVYGDLFADLPGELRAAAAEIRIDALHERGPRGVPTSPLHSRGPRDLKVTLKSRPDPNAPLHSRGPLPERLAAAKELIKAEIAKPEVAAKIAASARRVSAHGKKQLLRQSKAALGSEPWIADTKTEEVLKRAVKANVAYISGLTDELAARTERAVLLAVTTGQTWQDLAPVLERTLRFGEARAALIARDQVQKLNGTLSAIRQQELGIEEFVWDPPPPGPTRRPDHQERRGKVYRYDRPPADGLPGHAINCQCQAIPVFRAITERK